MREGTGRYTGPVPLVRDHLLAAPAQAATHTTSANPYSPAYRHDYRHGATPTSETLGKMR
jgi:hypothetical protein